MTTLFSMFVFMIFNCNHASVIETKLYGGSGGNPDNEFSQGLRRISSASWILCGVTLTKTNSTGTFSKTFRAISSFYWESIDINSSNWNFRSISSCGSAATTNITGNCTGAINLDTDDYINSYRVKYSNFVNGLYFRSYKNIEYGCETTTTHKYNDTDWIVNHGYYLSGFKWRSGGIVDAIGFEFTAWPTLSPSSTPSAQPTMPTTVIPTTVNPTTMYPTTSTDDGGVICADCGITTETTDNIQKRFEDVDNNTDELYWIIGGIGVFLLLFCLGILLIIIYYHRHKMKQISKTSIKIMNVEMVSQKSVVSEAEIRITKGETEKFDKDIDGEKENMEDRNEGKSDIKDVDVVSKHEREFTELDIDDMYDTKQSTHITPMGVTPGMDIEKHNDVEHVENNQMYITKM